MLEQKPRNVGDRVSFRISDTEIPTWTVAATRLEATLVGDSRRTYQLTKSNGEPHDGGAWVPQNELLDP